jgi:hypothetical protein
MQLWTKRQIACDAGQLGNVPIIHHDSLEKRENLKSGEMSRDQAVSHTAQRFLQRENAHTTRIGGLQTCHHRYAEMRRDAQLEHGMPGLVADPGDGEKKIDESTDEAYIQVKRAFSRLQPKI